MSPEQDPACEAFKRAQQAFRKKVANTRHHDEILTKATIDDVYEAASKAQEELAGQGGLKYLSKIEPFLGKLREYALVIEVFVQVKPEVLALIWGPIKLVLLWTTKMRHVMDEIASAMMGIGEALPRFAMLAATFETSDTIRAALALFYEDILDFHGTVLDLLQTKRDLKQNFKSLWKKPEKKIELIISNLKKHQDLLREEITLVDIKEAKEARTRSFKYFETSRSAEESRQYCALKANTATIKYQERLDWFRNRSVPDCGAWLFREAEFEIWSSTEAKKSLFWLRGMPGAGKSYLSASVVDHAKRLTRGRGRTLFAFVSYTERSLLNARAVILSLLFQAADEDEDLQSLLIQPQERGFRENVSLATLLLQRYLTKASGTTYIIIDGLDEMEEQERQILLQRLDDLSKACGNLRLLISSRIEHDILAALKGSFASVRVDEKNFGGIQTYVDYRCEKWMNESDFAPEVRREFKELISPLSARATGMILYARILLDNLEYMSSIEEIRYELRAPPADLDDAYHRIFDRINQANPLHREKARKILGWIACAPAPLTQFEMEQALSIKLDPATQSSGIARSVLHTNFTKLCGPIVEIVEEQLRFVHFTAKEYVFSKDISQSIDREWAAVDLTSTLLAYLGSGVLDQELEDQEVEENVLKGTYRLFEYANFFWPVLFNKTAVGNTYSSRLGALLDRVIQGGRNYSFQDVGQGSSKSYFKNDHLESSMPDVYHVVYETFRFRLLDERWEWNRSNSKYRKTSAENVNNINQGDLWSSKDPLVTSKALVRIQECQEELARQQTHQARLESQYGSGLFKCTYPFCAQSYRGFKAENDRDEHIVIHGKPWRCSISNCPYGSIGFSSKDKLDDHWSRLHIPSSGKLSIGISDPDSLDVAEAQPILFLLVSEDNVEDANRILAAPGGRQLGAEVISSARQIAAKRGCLEMIQLLAPPNEVYMPYRTVVAAVGSEDVTVARAAIAKAQPEDYPQLMKALISTQSDEIYELWEEHIKSLPKEVLASGFHERKNFCDQLFKGALFTAAKGKPLREARLRQAMRMLSHHMTPSLLGSLLVRVSKSSCSVHLAQELLDLGAPVDYPWGFSKSGMTALHIAAKKTSEEAAYFMQYLISQGAAGLEKAYPASHDPARIGAERGAKDVLKYVGQTFEEMRQQSLLTRNIAIIEVD